MKDDRVMRKGDIFHINDGNKAPIGDEQWSDRPGLIISNDIANKHAGVVTIVYLKTDKKRRLRPTHIPIVSGDTKGIALCEQVFTVDKSRVAEYIGHITDDEMTQIDDALMFQFGINPAARPTSIFKKWENYIIRNNMNIDEYTPIETQTTDKPSSTDYTKLLESEIKTLTDEVEKYKTLYNQSKTIITNK